MDKDINQLIYEKHIAYSMANSIDALFGLKSKSEDEIMRDVLRDIKRNLKRAKDKAD